MEAIQTVRKLKNSEPDLHFTLYCCVCLHTSQFLKIKISSSNIYVHFYSGKNVPDFIDMTLFLYY